VQAPASPHWDWPLQDWQAAPPRPHEALSVPGRQRLVGLPPWVSQQPAQVAGLQTHVVPVQVSPAVQRLPAMPPQAHWLLTQVLPPVQATQRVPARPQAALVRVVTHWPPSGEQHPVQVARLQTQVPLRQRKPLAHAGPLPHRQPASGVASQLLLVVALQVAHEPPSGPHTPASMVRMQVEPWQQPSVQVAKQPLQAPPTQVLPAEHAWHAPPPAPHAAAAVPGEQMPASVQQPEAQVVESHTQVPETQRAPAPQAAAPPH
jgi:hypothetical protein